jgi:hypothetical protein
MKIAFTDHFIGRTGSMTALYDLAHYNETILGNESIIIAQRKHPEECLSALKKFQDRFEVFEIPFAPTGFGPWNLLYGDVDAGDKVIAEQNVDALFLMSGCKTPFQSRIVPNLVQMLFLNSPDQYFGDRFAFISDWLSDTCKSKYGVDKPSVPWMINIKDVDTDLRKELGIPSDAFVFGYHGGAASFAASYGLHWVNEPIRLALEHRKDLYIVLMNVDKSQTSLNFDHPRLIWLTGTADMQRKSEFIKTCNAMLHTRHCGETFGLSCGEFSTLNRPIVGCTTVEDRCHIEILKEKFIGYSNPQELFNILMGMNHDFVKSQNWDCYSDKYNPEIVMKKFKEVYLDNLIKQ